MNKTDINKRLKELRKKRDLFYDDADQVKYKWIKDNKEILEDIEKEEKYLRDKLAELNEEKPKKRYFERYGVDFGNTNREGLEIIEETDRYVLTYVKGCSGYVDRVSGLVYSSPEFIIFDKINADSFKIGEFIRIYKRGERKIALKESIEKLKELQIKIDNMDKK